MAPAGGGVAAEAAIGAARAACGVVLVCWDHCQLPALLRALGCTTTRCETCWPDGRYDQVEQFEVGTDGAVRQRPGVVHEGFRADDDGIDPATFECLNQAHLVAGLHTGCRLPPEAQRLARREEEREAKETRKQDAEREQERQRQREKERKVSKEEEEERRKRAAMAAERLARPAGRFLRPASESLSRRFMRN